MALTLDLERFDRCFAAALPSMIASSSRTGVPNVVAVSAVLRIDERHVAVSRQFFRKTHANLTENPFACIEVTDPVTYEVVRMTVRFDHEETSGALFDQVAARIDAEAALTGMVGVFKLQAVSVFEVLSAELMPGALLPEESPDTIQSDALPAVAIDAMTQLRALRRIADCVRVCEDAEPLVDGVLGVLEEVLGFDHSLVLVADEPHARLYAIASRGYAESGVGAEVRFGEGVIGTVARTRKLLRIGSLDHARRYSRAQHLDEPPRADEIAMPGWPDAESCMAIPLVAHDELVGVIYVESRHSIAYGERDEAFLDVVAGQVALALQDLVRRADDTDAPSPAITPPPKLLRGSRRQFVFYGADDCVFVDGQYLVRNVPGRILWKLLREFVDGRRAFSNRELRLDPQLGLPELRDNLESRLILLRKRLAEKCPDVAIVPAGRGRFVLEVSCAIDLVNK